MKQSVFIRSAVLTVALITAVASGFVPALSAAYAATPTLEWYSQVAIDEQVFEDVASLDASTAVAVGWKGVILKTTDGGATWENHNFRTSDDLRSVFFVNEQVGYAVGGDYGTGSLVLKTTDGGNTWTALPSGLKSSLESVFFTDVNTGWVVGRAGVIAATIDGGATWRRQHADVNHWFSDVHFVSPTTGWVVGDTIQKTTDGGATWRPESNPMGYPLNAVDFVDSTHGWAAGGDMAFGWYAGQSVILKTTDGGTTWDSYYPSLEDYLQDVDFINTTTGWAVGGGGWVLRTTDGGSTWNKEQSNTRYTVMGVNFVDDSNGWAVGIDGIQHFGAEPPVTTSDARSLYADSATVHLSPTDYGGGPGVAHTYYTLNGGSPTESSTVVVSAVGSYRLSFWSVDESGTIEPRHSAEFTVIATPPPDGSPSTASVPSSVKHGPSFTTYGYIRRHKSGTSPVTLQFFRNQSGRWVLRKTVPAKVSNILTFSKYAASTSVPYSGKWRVRAGHKVGTKYLYSGYRTFTAK